MARIAAILVAGGSGSRLGGLAKQYRLLGGVAVLRRAAQAFTQHPRIDLVQVVIAEEDASAAARALQGLPVRPPVIGGATRQHSVRAGLEALANHKIDCVLVHDAARPFVSARLIDAVIDAWEAGAQAVVPALTVAETLKLSSGPQLVTTPREHLHGAQTPQGFDYALLRRLHAASLHDTATDDAQLCERAGIAVVLVAGERRNFKITTQDDWHFAETLTRCEEETRVGTGFDVHRLVEHASVSLTAKQVVHLCGVTIPHTHRLDGHSDADVGLHALVDALLGAMGEGDIGTHFPPSDPQWRGADSARFVLHALHLLRQKGGRLLHADVTLICEAPKIGPHREAMRARLAELLDAPPHRISVKATTTERLGFAGRNEGIAAQAVATIALPIHEG